MIYEVRTYTLKPGTVPQAEQAFADKIAERVKYSPLAGFWRSEVGPLNQIIHIWPYKDTAERAKIRAEVVEKKVWPPAISDFVVNMESKIMVGAPFSPNFAPGEHGGIYEFRTYTYATAMIPKVMDVWAKHVQARAAAVAADLRGLSRHRHAQPVGPCLGLQEHGRARAHPRRGRRQGHLAAAARSQHRDAAPGDDARHPGQVLTAQVTPKIARRRRWRSRSGRSGPASRARSTASTWPSR